MKTYDNVLFELENGVGVLTFNRPKVLNALDAHTIEEMSEVLTSVENDAKIRALVVTGAGDRAFAAGADIAAMSVMTPLEARRFSERAHATLERLEHLPIPTLAAVNGFALGGGCEVALACDLLYASDRARFGQPEVNLGLLPGFGGSQRLPRRVGVSRALEMILSGDVYDAARAREIGLALEVISSGELLPFVKAKAATIASRGPIAVAVAKRIVRAGNEPDLGTANELERQAFAALFGTSDAKEGMRAFLEKRTPSFTGA